MYPLELYPGPSVGRLYPREYDDDNDDYNDDDTFNDNDDNEQFTFQPSCEGGNNVNDNYNNHNDDTYNNMITITITMMTTMMITRSSLSSPAVRVVTNEEARSPLLATAIAQPSYEDDYDGDHDDHEGSDSVDLGDHEDCDLVIMVTQGGGGGG